MNTAADGFDPLRFGDACAAAAILAIDPALIGGITLRARYGPTRRAWLSGLERLMGTRGIRRLPSRLDDTVLFGGLDIAASLAKGQGVWTPGILARGDDTVLLLPAAERCSAAIAARIAHVMDGGTSAFGLVALDEGIEADEATPAILTERLSIHLTLREWPAEQHTADWPIDAGTIEAARSMLASITAGQDVLEAVCETATTLGIDSLRPPLAALQVARCAAALDGRGEIDAQHLALATRLVLAPRATRWPDHGEDETETTGESEPTSDETTATAEDQSSSAAEDGDGDSSDDDISASSSLDNAPSGDRSTDESTKSERTDESDSIRSIDETLDEIMLDAAVATLPDDVLHDMTHGDRRPTARGEAGGRHGPSRASRQHGRPLASRPGQPDGQHRLDVIATLRAAAPWQRLRGRIANDQPLRIRTEDFQIRRYADSAETATLFVVDASGSSALHRLAEAKGAVELLLADCYVRRDRVGLIVFRGRSAETVLTPTRSLTRAKRVLSGLPGGGPTPLASALVEAGQQAAIALRGGLAPRIVILTDGRGNIDLAGQADRQRATAECRQAGRALAARGERILVIDTSPRPRPAARELADTLAARYLALPQAGAGHLSSAIRELVA